MSGFSVCYFSPTAFRIAYARGFYREIPYKKILKGTAEGIKGEVERATAFLEGGSARGEPFLPKIRVRGRGKKG